MGRATSCSSAPVTRAARPSSSRGTRGKAKAGLHPTTASFLAERRVAALGSDGNNDTAPSTTEGVGFPIHVLALNAMGIHLLDYLQFEDLARHCEADGRWEFLFVAAPLRIAGDRVAAQPDRDLLTPMLLLRVYATSAALDEVARGSRSTAARGT